MSIWVQIFAESFYFVKVDYSLVFFFFFEKESYSLNQTKKSHTENLRSRTEKQLTTQIRLQKRQYKGRGNALPDLTISNSSSVPCELMGH